MSKRVARIASVVCAALWLFTAAGRADVPPDEPVTDMPELWFPVGERLVYQVYWGRIPVGRTEVTTQWTEHEGRTLLAIRYRTQSNRFIEKIYPVDDYLESLIDPETFLPVRFTKNLKEGRYRAHEITEFDHPARTASWRSLTRDKQKSFQIEEDTRCLISFSYYIRRKGFRVGNRSQHRVMADDKIYDLWLKADKMENVSLPNYGRVSSVRVEPEAAFEGLFVRKGKVTFWVSRDYRHVMTRLVGSIPVASIRLVLVNVRGPGDDFWIRNGSDDDEELYDDVDT